MRISDFSGVFEVNDEEQLQAAFNRRFCHEANTLWLSNSAGDFPVMVVMLTGDLATLHYLPFDNHPGFISLGSIPELNSDGVSLFYLQNDGEEQETPNYSVLPSSLALLAAKEFLRSRELPKSVEWFEL